MPESSGGRIRSFPLSTWFPPWFSMLVSLEGWTVGPLVSAVQRLSLIPSTWSWSSLSLPLVRTELQVLRMCRTVCSSGLPCSSILIYSFNSWIHILFFPYISIFNLFWYNLIIRLQFL
jgi:hypothetical protein